MKRRAFLGSLVGLVGGWFGVAAAEEKPRRRNGLLVEWADGHRCLFLYPECWATDAEWANDFVMKKAGQYWAKRCPDIPIVSLSWDNLSLPPASPSL